MTKMGQRHYTTEVVADEVRFLECMRRDKLGRMIGISRGLRRWRAKENCHFRDGQALGSIKTIVR